MDEIEKLLADETFCRNLLTTDIPNDPALHEIKLETLSDFNAWSQQDASTLPLHLENDMLESFDSVINNSAAKLSPAESGRSSITESGSGTSLATYGNTQYSNEQSSAYSYLMSEFEIPSSKLSSGESSSNSNSDPLDDQFEPPYDEDLDLDLDANDTDADADEDVDLDFSEAGQQGGNKQGGKPKNGGQSQPTTKKPPLFQPLRSTGELKLTELEKQTLAQEGLSIQTRLPLSKHDERILKQVRRKIRNKISAQESRRKKRAHVDELELRLKQFARENRELRAKLKERNDALHKVKSRFTSLQAFITRHIRLDLPPTLSSSPPGTVPTNNLGQQHAESARASKQPSFGLHSRPAFMALFLCFAVLVGCRPGALHSAGFFFSSSPSAADVQRVRAISNITNDRCEIALIAYPCDEGTTDSCPEDFEIKEYYFDGHSFFDRNAPSIRSLRTLKRFSDQSNVFRDGAVGSAEGSQPSYVRSAIDSLLNALRYSTARTLFRRTVSATGEKLAAKLKRDNYDSVGESSNDVTELQAGASSANVQSNGKLLDQRAAPGRTLLFKWSMTNDTVSDWLSKVMRSFVGESCCMTYMY